MVRTFNIFVSISVEGTDASRSGEIMSNNSSSIEELTSLYMSQSPTAFTSIAMHAKAPNDHNDRVDTAEHGGDKPCDYSCCSEKGYCNSMGWHLAIVGGAVVCCACCCYCTHGFNGVWTYWPF